MNKDIVSLIVDDLIKGLPRKTPDTIFVYGGGEIFQSVTEEMRLRVDSFITEGPFMGSVYTIDLEYFVRLYGRD